jgi:hypothetical protein
MIALGLSAAITGTSLTSMWVGCPDCDVRWLALTVDERPCFMCEEPGRACNYSMSNPYTERHEESENASDR